MPPSSQTHNPLASGNAKLRRAHEHLKRLRQATSAFLEREPYRERHEVDPSQTHHVFKLEVLAEPPVDLSLMAADVVQNARSALNHYLFGFADHKAVVALTDEEARQVQYPIVDSQKSLKEKVKDGWLGGIQDTAFIEAAQPYRGDDTLAVLRDLSNIDKHRRLVVLFAATRQASYGTPHPANLVGEPDWNRGPLVDGAPILSLRFAQPRPEVDVKLMGLRLGLAFEPVQEPPGAVLLLEDTLSRTLAFIESAVRDEFARRV